VPNSASITTSAPSSSSLDLPPRPPPAPATRSAVAAVRALTADRRDPLRVRVPAQHGVGDARARSFHHRLDVVALLGGAHLVRRVERREHQACSTTATALASSREWVIERSMLPGTALLGPARDAPAERHRRLRPSHDLDVAPGERARDSEAERLADGLLAREASGIALRGIRARVAVACSAAVKQRSRKRG
jgi:hypothetical protein